MLDSSDLALTSIALGHRIRDYDSRYFGLYTNGLARLVIASGGAVNLIHKRDRIGHQCSCDTDGLQILPETLHL